MDPSLPNLSSLAAGARRNEDIALDLLKFVATLTEIGKPQAVGFQQAGGAKGQEQTDKILDLYARCLSAVQGTRR